MDEQEKRDRQLIELLNELRVALPGVQILFAFLLTVPFSVRFEKLTSFQRTDYFVTLLATTLSAACLIAPSAAHRLRFHRHDRAWLVESASMLTIAGLAALAVAMTGAVTLISDVLYDGIVVWIFSILVALTLIGLWFARPLLRGDESSGP
jgi:membrane-associated HD superfamily phosphohydrolase